MVGSHQEWRDPAIPTRDPRWDGWDPAGIPPDFLHGKAQKYTRIGPRKFFPFDESEEMTIGNIKSACERHFLPRIGKNPV